MKITLVGQIASTLGACAQTDRAGGIDRFSMPAANFRQCQPQQLPIVFDHDESWPLGRVVYLERSAPDGLLAVATIDADVADLLADGPWFLSAGCRTVKVGPTEYGGTLMREVSLVRAPAQVMTRARPVQWSRTNIVADGGSEPFGLPLRWRDTWRRAHLLASSYRFQRAGELTILDVEAIDASAPTPAPTPPPASVLEPSDSEPARQRAARHAHDYGVNGYGWEDEHGVRRRIGSYGGTVLALT